MHAMVSIAGASWRLQEVPRENMLLGSGLRCGYGCCVRSSVQAMRAGLLTTTYLQAMSISQDKRSYQDTAQDDTLRAQIDVRRTRVALP